MASISKSDPSGIIGLMHNGNGEIALPIPFGQEVFLFDTTVAGTTHIKNLSEIELKSNQKLLFFREPDNQHDKNAIAISTENRTKIGYVPQADNPIFARLLDAGKVLYARVSDKYYRGSWMVIHIKVYLED